MQIREASTIDLPGLIEIGRAFWEHTRYFKQDGIPYDEYTSGNLIRTLVRTDMGLVLVAYEGAELVGVIMMIIAPLIYSGDILQANELAYYVKPEARSTGAGQALLRAAEDECRKRDCKYINIMYMHSSMPERVAKLYTRMGYEPVEQTHVKVLA